MQPSEFTKDAPGRLIQAPSGYWSFVPDPLPPRLTWTDELVAALSEADRAVGRLAGEGSRLAEPRLLHLLSRPFVRNEAVLSSRIEGTRTVLEQLLLFEQSDPAATDEADPDDAREVSNYVRALEGGLRALEAGAPISLHLIRQLHAALMEDVRGGDKNPGAWRTRPVFIDSRPVPPEQARFVPPPPELVPECLEALVSYLRAPARLPPLVRAAVAHYQFETIHPFNDGNGRVGRLLITLMLAADGLLTQPPVYLSAYFEARRREYYDGLLSVSRSAGWADWIAFFLRGIAAQAHDACERVGRLLGLREEWRAACSPLPRPAKAVELVDRLFAYPAVGVGRAAELLGVTFPTAQNVIDRLVGLGLLREVTGRQRNRVYLAERIVRMLDEPAPQPGAPP